MTKFKQKFVGILLIIVGIFPLLNGIKFIADFLAKYPALSYFTGGGIVYQAILIILGIILVWERRNVK